MDKEIWFVVDDFLDEILGEPTDNCWAQEVSCNLGKLVQPLLLIGQTLFTVNHANTLVHANIDSGWFLLGADGHTAGLGVQFFHGLDKDLGLNGHIDGALEVNDTFVTLLVNVTTLDQSIDLLVAHNLHFTHTLNGHHLNLCKLWSSKVCCTFLSMPTSMVSPAGQTRSTV